MLMPPRPATRRADGPRPPHHCRGAGRDGSHRRGSKQRRQLPPDGPRDPAGVPLHGAGRTNARAPFRRSSVIAKRRRLGNAATTSPATASTCRGRARTAAATRPSNGSGRRSSITSRASCITRSPAPACWSRATSTATAAPTSRSWSCIPSCSPPATSCSEAPLRRAFARRRPEPGPALTGPRRGPLRGRGRIRPCW